MIEAVTVCVGYADFLRETAAVNRPHLTRWVVVTDPKDRETRRVCDQFGLECILSDEHQRDGAFSKGRAINRGLAHVSGKDWLLHLDADIALPADLEQVLDDAHLDRQCVYGCDRLNVHGYAKWLAIKSKPLLCRSNPWAMHMTRDLPVGARVANVGHGYTPIGFFQLWHGSKESTYPFAHGTAARTDVQFALRWDRRDRVLIPELLVWHLESEPGQMGINWSGRKSPPFVQPKAYC